MLASYPRSLLRVTRLTSTRIRLRSSASPKLARRYNVASLSMASPSAQRTGIRVAARSSAHPTMTLCAVSIDSRLATLTNAHLLVCIVWDVNPFLMAKDAPFKDFKPSHKIGHNCQTGRWLTVLKAQWSSNPDVYPHFTVRSSASLVSFTPLSRF